ncbi:chimeric protein acly CoA binding/Acyl CoA binding protein, putative [Blumeria hordei DH14]|uniref:Chimeric protein acly CoA binding/Acyl CoA binding protein, putative n=1 Tax=Blumeria graminis f. sp. hordei (strain DH14) TaxID=546991 RepID=N1JKX5_BLUG1|nr:chimeric protein acly CoA binding/Acyl CoA binding protein, putative [Blumeria hordei DH14]
MRPPSTERLRLYGLYKQAMEGDVDGVMERPASVGSNQDEPEDTRKDRQKYDSWDAQRGLSRTEAKRRYVEALIETMHRYASTTADARALVDELEFVWDQIKNNSVASNGSSPRRATSGMEVPDYCTPRHSRYPPPNAGENMRVLSPESHEDELERKGERRIWYSEHSEGIYGGEKNDKGRETIEWRRKVEQALMKMTAEVAALKEQTSNVWDHQGKRTKRKDLTNWLTWLWWVAKTSKSGQRRTQIWSRIRAADHAVEVNARNAVNSYLNTDRAPNPIQESNQRPGINTMSLNDTPTHVLPSRNHYHHDLCRSINYPQLSSAHPQKASLDSVSHININFQRTFSEINLRLSE